jgi:hypothetical protein
MEYTSCDTLSIHVSVRAIGMRLASVIILTLFVQLGLFGRLAGNGVCCPTQSMEHSHAHDSLGVETGHSHDDCTDDHHPADEGKCPPDCGEHHHHHGTCFHNMQMSLAGDGHCRLAPPYVVSLGCGWQHMQAPDGPVFELDKPPLI